VGLEIRGAAHGILLSVADDGPGIPPAERTRVFERFYRVTGRATGGSGLGLSIVQRIVEILSGTIELSAPAGASGLIVTIRLPLAGGAVASQSAA
jgi:signal transduction histidine kinase